VIGQHRERQNRVIVVGYGTIGRAVTESLEALSSPPTIVEQNIDTVPALREEKKNVLFGDATQPNILEASELESSKLLVITVPEIASTVAIIKSARIINPLVHIIARVNLLSDVPQLEELKVRYICTEREAAKVFRETVTNILKYL
jgi:CPA2 family monovalent cation:H+ antiporter-2